jgi:hypothetical protein
MRPLGFVDADIAGHRYAVTRLHDQGIFVASAIAIDHQSRNTRKDGGSTQCLRRHPDDMSRANIPSDMVG